MGASAIRLVVAEIDNRRNCGSSEASRGSARPRHLLGRPDSLADGGCRARRARRLPRIMDGYGVRDVRAVRPAFAGAQCDMFSTASGADRHPVRIIRRRRRVYGGAPLAPPSCLAESGARSWSRSAAACPANPAPRGQPALGVTARRLGSAAARPAPPQELRSLLKRPSQTWWRNPARIARSHFS